MVDGKPTIKDDGNEWEKSGWQIIGPRFPLYEKFWALHIFPLRSEGRKYIRANPDKTLEEIAMAHYTCFLNLWRAHGKAQNKVDRRFFPEIYSNLKQAADAAMTAAKKFESLCWDCNVHFAWRTRDSNKDLANFSRQELAPYRNCVHYPVPGYREGNDGTVLVPRKSKFPTGRGHSKRPLRWSECYSLSQADFVPIRDQFLSDFERLCSHLDACWKEMLSVSDDLRDTREYYRRVKLGDNLDTRFLRPSEVLSTDSSSLPTTDFSRKTVNDRFE